MHFYELIKNMSQDKKLDIYVDMDGVIASYDFGVPFDFKNKRPLKTNIKTLEKISKLKNVNVYILSICRKNFQITEKNEWLDEHAPFFDKDNRFIISKEKYPNTSSKKLKTSFLNKLNNKNNIVVIDDDNSVLDKIHEVIPEITLFQDSELID